jgi:hypothetical protein
MNEKRLMEILLEKRKLPHIFIVRDTFEVDCYVLEIGKDAIRNALTSEALPFSKTYFGVAIHIRIAGYNKLKSHEKVNLFSLLKHLMNQGCRSIDIFTDNIHELSRELIFPPDLKTVWPEILSPLSPPELLLKLSQYDYLITNGSSIARWANYLACSTSQQVFVNLTR